MVFEEKAKFQHILQDWNRRYEAGQPTLGKLAYILEHKYSEANLRLDRLKGRDRLLGRYLKELCAKENFVLLLGNMTLTVYNAEQEDSEDDGNEEHLAIKNIIDLQGNQLLPHATITDEEIIQRNSFHRQPDEEESEETGNEGMHVTHFYHDAVSDQ